MMVMMKMTTTVLLIMITYSYRGDQGLLCIRDCLHTLSWKNKKGEHRKQPLQQYPPLNTAGTNNYAADQKNRPARKTMTTGQLSISWTLL